MLCHQRTMNAAESYVLNNIAMPIASPMVYSFTDRIDELFLVTLKA